MAKCKKYTDILSELEKGSETSRRFSRGDYVDLTQGLLNSPETEITHYSNPSQEKPTAVVKKPAQAYRDSLKEVLGQFGVDKAEAEKINDVEFSKKHAEALIDVAQTVQHDYIASGKKLRLPQLSEKETVVTLESAVLPEKTEATKKIVDKQSVPTGRTVKTAERTIVKSRNKVPAWMQQDV